MYPENIKENDGHVHQRRMNHCQAMNSPDSIWAPIDDQHTPHDIKIIRVNILRKILMQMTEAITQKAKGQCSAEENKIMEEELSVILDGLAKLDLFSNLYRQDPLYADELPLVYCVWCTLLHRFEMHNKHFYGKEAVHITSLSMRDSKIFGRFVKSVLQAQPSPELLLSL
jgi:hypothetical protein